MCFFSTLWIDRDTTTVFELFCGLLTHLFSFSTFLHARCETDFCSISDSRGRYLKGQTGLLLKAETGIIDHGVRTIISVEQQVKVLFFQKKTGLQPWKWRGNQCQISKSTVAWIMWACIANNNFAQREPNQRFESCFQRLEVISLYLFMK